MGVRAVRNDGQIFSAVLINACKQALKKTFAYVIKYKSFDINIGRSLLL